MKIALSRRSLFVSSTATLCVIILQDNEFNLAHVSYLKEYQTVHVQNTPLISTKSWMNVMNDAGNFSSNLN